MIFVRVIVSERFPLVPQLLVLLDLSGEVLLDFADLLSGPH